MPGLARHFKSGCLAALLLVIALPASAAPTFPALTGRVVDNADLLSPNTERELTAKLAAHESATGEQVVVVTLPGLQGLEISDYGYQLGRHWGIGQKGKNDGAMLIVAPSERQMRIEVGYGLEGRLTDAQSSLIISRVLTPAFKAGQYEAGIVAGTDAMLTVLGGDAQAIAAINAAPASGQGEGSLMKFFVILCLYLIFRRFTRGSRRRNSGLLDGLIIGTLASGRSGRGFGGSGGFGGGFRGGGGGFGGGGASGRW